VHNQAVSRRVLLTRNAPIRWQTDELQMTVELCPERRLACRSESSAGSRTALANLDERYWCPLYEFVQSKGRFGS
jgi:hypothetical protein